MAVKLLLIAMAMLSLVSSTEKSAVDIHSLPSAISVKYQSVSALMRVGATAELKGRLLDEYEGEDWEKNKPSKQQSDAFKNLRSGLDENWSKERRQKVHAGHSEELMQKLVEVRNKQAQLAKEKHLQYSNMVPSQDVPEVPMTSTINHFKQRLDTAAPPQQESKSKQPKNDYVLILLRAFGAILLLIGLIVGVRKLLNKAEKMVQVETLRSGQELEVLTSVKLSQL